MWSSERGFSLLQMVFTIALLAILARYAVPRFVQSATLTVPSQARSVADTVRRGQSQATLRGARMQVSVAASGANGQLAVSCAASGACNTVSSYTLAQGAVLGGATSVYFNSLGQPVSSSGTPLTTDTSFTISYTGAPTHTVTVSALTGRVSVSP